MSDVNEESRRYRKLLDLIVTLLIGLMCAVMSYYFILQMIHVQSIPHQEKVEQLNQDVHAQVSEVNAAKETALRAIKVAKGIQSTELNKCTQQIGETDRRVARLRKDLSHVQARLNGCGCEDR